MVNTGSFWPRYAQFDTILVIHLGRPALAGTGPTAPVRSAPEGADARRCWCRPWPGLEQARMRPRSPATAISTMERVWASEAFSRFPAVRCRW